MDRTPLGWRRWTVIIAVSIATIVVGSVLSSAGLLEDMPWNY